MLVVKHQQNNFLYKKVLNNWGRGDISKCITRKKYNSLGDLLVVIVIVVNAIIVIAIIIDIVVDIIT